jgi:dephospho-CoA kinase
MTTVVGILGAIGSGKSTVSRLLRDLGASVIDADHMAHQVLDEPEVIDAIRAAFGGDVLDAHGHVERRKLAARVFTTDDPAALERLNAIVHPRVRQRIESELARARRDGTSVVVLDVPLLLESGLAGLCDRLLFVQAPQAARMRRLAERGWSGGDLERREARQTALDDKRSRAHVVIENDGDVGALERTLVPLYRSWAR